MKKITLSQDKNLSGISARSALDEVLRDGARKMLQEAIEAEVDLYIQDCQELRDQMNRRIVTRNGHLPSRDILTGIGSLNIRQSRVRGKKRRRCLFKRNSSKRPLSKLRVCQFSGLF